MSATPELHRLVPVALVEQEIDAHLTSLRRKLQQAERRGEPVEGLRARIRSEEELLRRMRAYQPARRETGGPQ